MFTGCQSALLQSGQMTQTLRSDAYHLQISTITVCYVCTSPLFPTSYLCSSTTSPRSPCAAPCPLTLILLSFHLHSPITLYFHLLLVLIYYRLEECGESWWSWWVTTMTSSIPFARLVAVHVIRRGFKLALTAVTQPTGITVRFPCLSLFYLVELFLFGVE